MLELPKPSLPLDDGVLFLLRSGHRTARSIGTKLNKDQSTVYPVLNRLINLGLVRHGEGKHREGVYELEHDVTVDHRSGRLVVEKKGDGDPRRNGREDSCLATTTRGSRCKRTPRAGAEYCVLHGSLEA